MPTGGSRHIAEGTTTTNYRAGRRGRRTLAATTTIVVALVLFAGSVDAGVPDQRLHDVDEATFGECGYITLWFDDHVDFRKSQFWNSAVGEVAATAGNPFSRRATQETRAALENYDVGGAECAPRCLARS